MGNHELTKNIKKFRSINEFTQQEVADRLGIDRTTYSKYESGKATPQFHNVVKLAEVYGVTVGELCGRSFEETIGFADIAGFSTEELRLVFKFRALSERRKQEVLRVTNRLTNDQEKEEENK